MLARPAIAQRLGCAKWLYFPAKIIAAPSNERPNPGTVLGIRKCAVPTRFTNTMPKDVTPLSIEGAIERNLQDQRDVCKH